VTEKDASKRTGANSLAGGIEKAQRETQEKSKGIFIRRTPYFDQETPTLLGGGGEKAKNTQKTHLARR